MKPLEILIYILFFTNATTSETIQMASSNSTLANTKLRPVVERVFSRKRRFLLGPSGCLMKFTAALNKHLISSFPRGFQFVLEAAFYYPCPSTRADLLPKRFKVPTTPKSKPIGTTTPTYVYIPGSLIHFKAKPALKPAKVQRIDEGSVKWMDKPHLSVPQENIKYTNPSKWTQWDKYGKPAYAQKYEWTPAKLPQYQWHPSQHAKWNKWTTKAPNEWWSKKNTYDEWPRRHRWGRDIHRPFERETGTEHELHEVHPYEPMYYPDMEPFEDWRHYHSHRERRQLFEHFGGLNRILGIDMKSCILRAICDAKLLLLPKGYSMIHDILRVIFNFPTISGLNDEYSRTMKEDFSTCDQQLRSQCPFSFLDLMLNPKKGL